MDKNERYVRGLQHAMRTLDNNADDLGWVERDMARAAVALALALQDDARRLDWLQGFTDVRLEAWFEDGEVGRRVAYNGHALGRGRTLRQAIDAARAACPRGPADAAGVTPAQPTQENKHD